jgi:quinol monooxygenase YgiN
VRNQNNPDRFLLIQQWNSVNQQQSYITWRIERGALAELRTLLTEDPIVRCFTPVDMLALPSQAREY